MVDDSIVRGTTTRQVVAMLREAGAAEVHFRVSSPPYKWPCFYGMDTGRRSELLAADLSVGEIKDYLKVDSLAYLELERSDRGHRTLRPSRSAPRASPVSIRCPCPDVEDAKLVLEKATKPAPDDAGAAGHGREPDVT